MLFDKIFRLGLVLIEDETYLFYEYKQTQIYITRKRLITTITRIFNWISKRLEKTAS